MRGTRLSSTATSSSPPVRSLALTDISGAKSFLLRNAGGVISDVTVLEGVLEDEAKTHVFAYVSTKDPGISFKGDWDVIGQRLTVILTRLL